MENVGAIPFLDFKHFASRIFFPEVDTDTSVHTWQTVTSDSTKQPFCSCFQSESMMASCIKDIGQVGFNTSFCWYWFNFTLYLCEWFGVVFDLKSGCGAGSAWRVLPGLVQADPRPALPHIYGARSGGAEELRHQRQVSLWCLTVCVSLKYSMIQQMSEAMVKVCKFVLFCGLVSNLSGLCSSTFLLSSVLIHCPLCLLLLYICLDLSMLLLFLAFIFGWKKPNIFKLLFIIYLLSLHCTMVELGCGCVLFLPTFYLLNFNCPPPGVLWHHYSP